MVAEAPNGTPPLFYYYDIVCIFLYRMYSLNNGLFFWKWYGLGLNQKFHTLHIRYSPKLDDIIPIVFQILIGGT